MKERNLQKKKKRAQVKFEDDEKEDSESLPCFGNRICQRSTATEYSVVKEDTKIDTYNSPAITKDGLSE